MTQSLPSPDALLVTIVLATLAIGLPILMVMSIRFLWDRNISLGRSKELEKLIWQLHRIASVMEHQMKLSSPTAQPGMDEARDPTYAQQLSTQPATARSPAGSAATASPTAHQVSGDQRGTPPPAVQPASVPASAPQKPSAEANQHGGVNSMFGF